MSSTDAELYARTHRGNAGDVAFYERVCRGAQSVLELGCGYGRMLLALAQPGRELFGLELDPSLRRLGRAAVRTLPESHRARVRIVPGDMQSFALSRCFARVILPYNGLYCLLSARDVERCFRSVRSALTPDGAFAFDVWNADGLEAHGLASAREDEAVMRVEQGGRVWSVFEHCRPGRSARRLDVTYTYESEGVSRSQVVRQRYYESAEIERLLDQCGFRVRSKYGSFRGGRFSERSTRLVIVAEPRAL